MLYFNRIHVSEGVALINSFLHTPLSINSLHLHLHFSSFQRFLSLQTSFMPFYVSCCISSWHQTENFKIQIFNNISNTRFSMRIIYTVATTTASTCFNTKRQKHRIIPININSLRSYFTFLIVHWNTIQRTYAR